MLFLVALAAAVLTIPVAGGRFAALADLRLHGRPLLAVALAVQIVAISVLRRPPHVLAAFLHLLSYALAGAFLFANRRLSGVPLVALGGGLNLVAIAANGGTMPAATGALRRAGVHVATDHFANSAPISGARLPFLGDVFAVPAGLGIANVFSVGDLVICVGVVVLLHAAARCRWTVAKPVQAAER
jgi:hypothetical protein